MVAVLTTDFGPHPPEAWAQATAERLLPEDSTAARANLTTLMRLRADFMDILTNHHAAAQDHERVQLHDDEARFHQPHDGPVEFDKLLDELRTKAKGTSWEAHLAKPEVVQAIRDVVHDHTASIRHVERLWHADNNPHIEAGQAYRAKHALPPSPTR